MNPLKIHSMTVSEKDGYLLLAFELPGGGCVGRFQFDEVVELRDKFNEWLGRNQLPGALDNAKQFDEDRKLIDRVDTFGKGLRPAEKEMLESFKLRLEGGEPLTVKQRQVAQRIDDTRVG